MRRPPVLLHLFLTTGLLLTAGCSSGGDDAASTTTAATSTTADATTTTDDAGDDDTGSDDGEICPDRAAIETALGGPVDITNTNGFSMGASTDGTALSYQYSGCDIQLTEGGQGTATVARVTAAEVDGEPQDGSVFTTLQETARAEFVEDGFEPLTDVGADAYRDGSEVVFLSGAVMVFVEVEIDGEESVEAAVEMATALAASDQPIPSDDLDCEVLGALAPASFGAVTSASVSGGTTMIGDLTIERTGCGAEHANGHESSISVTDAAQWDAWVAANEGSTFTVHYTEVEVGGHAAFDDGEDLVIDDGDQPWIISARGDDLEPGLADVRRRLAEIAVGT